MEDATAAVAFRKYNIDSTTTLFAVGDIKLVAPLKRLISTA
jgi:hypothetical protein